MGGVGQSNSGGVGQCVGEGVFWPSRVHGGRSMNKALVFLMAVVALLAWALPGPREAAGTNDVPADAECAECGMSIADARFAARMVVANGDAATTLYFDDAGCLFDHERWHPGLVVRSREFAVSPKPRWLRSESVAFIVDPKIGTPMGTGLLVVDAAEAAGRLAGGERVESFEGAAAYRKQWMESRFGKPKP